MNLIQMTQVTLKMITKLIKLLKQSSNNTDNCGTHKSHCDIKKEFGDYILQPENSNVPYLSLDHDTQKQRLIIKLINRRYPESYNVHLDMRVLSTLPELLMRFRKDVQSQYTDMKVPQKTEITLLLTFESQYYTNHMHCRATESEINTVTKNMLYCAICNKAKITTNDYELVFYSDISQCVIIATIVVDVNHFEEARTNLASLWDSKHCNIRVIPNKMQLQ